MDDTKLEGSSNTPVESLSGKKRWGKLKSAIKFTAKLKPKEKDASENIADIEYLLVNFLPQLACFKEVCHQFELSTSSCSDLPEALNTLSSIDWVERLSRSSDTSPRVHRGEIILEFSPEDGLKESSTIEEEDTIAEETPSTKKKMRIFITFSSDPMFSYLCLPPEDREVMAAKVYTNVYEKYDRIFALNPTVEVLRQTCLADNPHDLRAWVKGYKWAFPQFEDDIFVNVDSQENKNVLNAFVAECLKYDVTQVISNQPITGLIHVSNNGDWSIIDSDKLDTTDGYT